MPPRQCQFIVSKYETLFEDEEKHRYGNTDRAVFANKESVSLFMYIDFLTLGYGYWVPGKKEVEKNMRF